MGRHIDSLNKFLIDFLFFIYKHTPEDAPLLQNKEKQILTVIETSQIIFVFA